MRSGNYSAPESENEHRECETATSAKASGVDELLPISRRPKMDARGGSVDTTSHPPTLVENLEKGKNKNRGPGGTGADPNQAYYWGCTRKGYWRISNSHILTTTLTTDFLKQRGWSWLGCFRG